MNTFERIAGILFSGSAIRIAGASLAVVVGMEAMAFFTDAMESVTATLDSLP